MKILLCVFLLSSLSGCATLDSFAKKYDNVADGALNASIWTLCEGAPVGAVVREFGGNQKSADAWFQLCFREKTTFELRGFEK